MDFRTIGKQYTFRWGYDHYLPLYLLALHYGDTITAQTIAHELRQEAPLLAKDNNYEKAKQVELMYEGGNTHYRYEIVKTWIFIGVIAVLVILLASFKMIDDKYCGRLENHDLNPSQIMCAK